ncbi:MAG: SPL family radical SAM protein [Methermicoccaceae archaeon]
MNNQKPSYGKEELISDFKPLSVEFKTYKDLKGEGIRCVSKVGDGSIIKRFDKTPFPVKPTDVVCPHFLELKWAYGCPFKCAWCYLQGTFRFLKTRTDPVVKDRERIRRAVLSFFNSSSPPEMLNTGEIADSLMAENGEPFSKFIVPLFEKQRRHKVLFLSKSSNVRHLLEIPEHNQTVLSFSVNADSVARRWEKGAPSVADRLEAAKRASEAGYEVRLRIDPIVPVVGWEEHYKELVDDILARFTPERITLGSLRGLQSTINNARDTSWVEYLSERSNWGRKVGFETRLVNFSTIIDHLSDYGYENVALCKETIEMWAALGLDWRKIRCNCLL